MKNIHASLKRQWRSTTMDRSGVRWISSYFQQLMSVHGCYGKHTFDVFNHGKIFHSYTLHYIRSDPFKNYLGTNRSNQPGKELQSRTTPPHGWFGSKTCKLEFGHHYLVVITISVVCFFFFLLLLEIGRDVDFEWVFVGGGWGREEWLEFWLF